MCVLIAACSGAGPGSSAKPLAMSALPDIDTDRVLAEIKTLASDEFEGRAPGSPGEERTVNYLVEQYKQMGLKPGNTDGTYIQKVPLVGITADGAPLTVRLNGKDETFRWKDDVVAWTKRVTDTVSIQNSEMVFVGYGVVAPEYDWDDYKGLDVKGKTLVMLINDPPVPDPADPARLDAKMFGGKAMTYYGRWTYKYEIGAQKGAAAILIIHETEPAAYPFSVVQNSNLGERFDLITPDKNMGRSPIEGWVSLEAGRRLLAMAGQDYDALKQQARTPGFRPISLGSRAAMTLHNTFRTIDSRNVVAKLEGSDPALKDQYVVYSAHWDHLGVGADLAGSDKIYNGAVDNASGVAGLLEIARAYTKLPAPPRRSILFLNVTAEEQGLLGSQYYAVAPIYPLAKTAANINLDEVNVWGQTKDITLIGYGASDLDDYITAAADEQGRVIRPDPEPEKGSYYRSDHFNFAKQGVPALNPDKAGVDYIGKPRDYSLRVRNDYTEHDYHQPSDEMKPGWDLSGAKDDLKVYLAVGYRVAQTDKLPEWKPGNEFRAIREASLTGGK